MTDAERVAAWMREGREILQELGRTLAPATDPDDANWMWEEGRCDHRHYEKARAGNQDELYDHILTDHADLIALARRFGRKVGFGEDEIEPTREEVHPNVVIEICKGCRRFAVTMWRCPECRELA